MTPTWQPYQEPLRTTLLRTSLIALALGLILSLRTGRLANWPAATLLALWPSFGGHWIEILFLNHLRPRLPVTRSIQIPARLATWFLGGILLFIGLTLTAIPLGRFHPIHPIPWPAWPLAGLAFILIELLAHTALQLRGRPSFYNGRG